MASALYNSGKEALANGTLDWDNGSAAVRVLLVTAGYTFNPDHNFVSSITNELSGTGYTRKDLAGRSVTKDNTNDRAVCDANDLTWSAIDAGVPVAAVAYLRVGADDTTPGDDILIGYFDFTALTTNGSDFNLVWNANGLFYLS